MPQIGLLTLFTKISEFTVLFDEFLDHLLVVLVVDVLYKTYLYLDF